MHIRHCVFFAALSFLSPTRDFTQTTSFATTATSGSATASKDPQAVAVASSALSAMGGMANSACTLSGQLTIADQSGQSFPIVLKNSGSRKMRIELSMPKGQNVMVVNDGVGTITAPGGGVRRLTGNNTAFRRAFHIPALSALAEYQSPNTKLEYRGAGSGSVDQIAITLAPSAQAGENFLASMSQTSFDVDRSTGFIAGMQFAHVAENDSEAKRSINVKFSDYQQINGLAIPFRQETYADGNLESTLVLQSADCTSPISDSEFTLPIK